MTKFRCPACRRKFKAVLSAEVRMKDLEEEAKTPAPAAEKPEVQHEI